MATAYTAKKSATADRAPTEDMHPADIIAALRKAGCSLRRLSLSNGYADGTLKKALACQYPNAEKLIADTIGVHPMQLWPSRYNKDGSSTRRPSLRGTHRKGLRIPRKSTSGPNGRHVNVGTAE